MVLLIPFSVRIQYFDGNQLRPVKRPLSDISWNCICTVFKRGYRVLNSNALNTLIKMNTVLSLCF